MSAASSWTDVAAAAAGGEVLAAGKRTGIGSEYGAASRRGRSRGGDPDAPDGHGTALAGANRKARMLVYELEGA